MLEKQPGYGIANWRELTAKLAKLPHVVAASPALYGQVYLYTAAVRRAPVLKGIQTGAELETSDMLRHMKPVAGRARADAGRDCRASSWAPASAQRWARRWAARSPS